MKKRRTQRKGCGVFSAPRSGQEKRRPGGRPFKRKKHEKENCLRWLNEKVSVFDIGTGGCAIYHPEFPKGQL